jgi:hypothetical protein
MKTIRQLSTELGISKEAIYKKVKFQLKDRLEGHVSKVDNVTRIDAEGELMIRQSLHRERREAIETVMDLPAGDGAPFEPAQAHIAEYVGLLREQIRAKDVQIETQGGHIGRLIRQLGAARGGGRPGRAAKDGSEAGPEKMGAFPRAKKVLKGIFGHGKTPRRL